MKKKVIIFAGHRASAAGEANPRLSADRVDEVKSKIRERLATLESGRTVGFASAAPGADLLFHEVCADLGIETIVCLPIPLADYSRLHFGDLDDWRNRFLRLMTPEKRKTTLELCGRPELPRWLSEPPKKPPVDLWERGNRWVFNIGATSSDTDLTLVVVWDGETDRNPGGTAHMVELARIAGTVTVEVISP